MEKSERRRLCRGNIGDEAGFSLELSEDGERICSWLGIQRATPAARAQDTFACTNGAKPRGNGLSLELWRSMEHRTYELRRDVACVGE